MLALRLGGDIGFVATWLVSGAAVVTGMLGWRRSGWRLGWAAVIALVGLEKFWSAAFAALGLDRLSGSLTVAPGVPWWFRVAWRGAVSSLPLCVAMVCAVVLAWSVPASSRCHPVASEAPAQGGDIP